MVWVLTWSKVYTNAKNNRSLHFLFFPKVSVTWFWKQVFESIFWSWSSNHKNGYAYDLDQGLVLQQSLVMNISHNHIYRNNIKDCTFIRFWISWQMKFCFGVNLVNQAIANGYRLASLVLPNWGLFFVHGLLVSRATWVFTSYLSANISWVCLIRSFNKNKASKSAVSRCLHGKSAYN